MNRCRRISLFAVFLFVLVLGGFVFAQSAVTEDGSNCADTRSGALTVPPRMIRAAGDWPDNAVEPTSKDNVIFIEQPAHLAWIAAAVNASSDDFDGKTISILNDLDLSAHAWVPIGGVNGTSFKGSVLGNDYVLSNMTVTKTTNYTGFIGSGADVEISNLHIRGGVVSGTSYVGGLIGYAVNVQISGSSIQGSITGVQTVGGIAGFISGGMIDNAHVLEDSTVEGSSGDVGGIVGFLQNGTSPTNTISNCGFYGASVASASDKAGGIVGNVNIGSGTNSVRGCIVSADISAASYAGGIVGHTYLQSVGFVIENCIVNGSVSATKLAAGGILGYSQHSYTSSIQISDCINNADVTLGLNNDDSTNISIGGIVGSAGEGVSDAATKLTIANTVNAGAVKLTGVLDTGSYTRALSLGGLVGAAVTDLILDISGSANLGVVSTDVDTTKEMYQTINICAGGLVGYYQALTVQDGVISNSYNDKDATVEIVPVTNGGLMNSYAGGILGADGGIVATTTGIVELTGVYNAADINVNTKSSGDAAGTRYEWAGGLFGRADVSDISESYSNAMAISTEQVSNANGIGDNTNTSLMALLSVYFNTRGGTIINSQFTSDCPKTETEMADPATFVSWASGLWDITTTAPPTPVFAAASNAAYLLSAGVIDIDPDGSGSITAYPTPSPLVRGDTPTYAWQITAGGKEGQTVWDEYFSAHDGLDTDTVTFTSNGTAVVATMTPDNNFMTTVIIPEGLPDPVYPGTITSFDIMGVPETLKLGETATLSLSYTTNDGTAPDPTPTVQWSVSSPAGSAWNVQVTQDADDESVATLSIATDDADATGYETFTVTAMVEQIDDLVTRYSGTRSQQFSAGKDAPGPDDPSGQITDFDLSGVPETLEIGIPATVSLDYTTDDKTTPNPAPTVVWSIDPDPGTDWVVTATTPDATNPGIATLSVSAVNPDADATGYESFTVTALVEQNGDTPFSGSKWDSFEAGKQAPVPPPTPGVITAFALSGVPVLPLEFGTTATVSLSYATADGSAPNPAPTATWSISPTAGDRWAVDVTPDAADDSRATLSVRALTTDVWEDYEDFTLTVRVEQIDGDTTLFDGIEAQGFSAGEAFQTHVDTSPEVQQHVRDMNDRLNGSGVQIAIGNKQPAIPNHLKPSDWSIASHLENMDLTYRTPEPDVLPLCFDSAGKGAASFVADVSDLADDDSEKILIPMSYAVRLEWREMVSFFGSTLAAQIIADPDGNLDAIFDVVVLHKQIREGVMSGWYTRLVRGVAAPRDAVDLGILDVSANAEARTLNIYLSYYVIDDSGESYVIRGRSDPNDANSAEIGYIILPDGLNNGTITDPIWLNRWQQTTPDDPVSGSSGGGCNTAGFAILLAAIATAALRRKETKA